MKKLLLLLLIAPVLGFGQTFVFEDTNLEWDISEMSVSGNIGKTQINGKMSPTKIGYSEYNVAEGDFGSLALMYLTKPYSFNDKSMISNIYISSNPLKELIKAIKKNNFSKVDIIYSNSMSYVLNKEIIIKRQLAQEQLDKNIEQYNGVYKVKIITSSGIRFQNEFGKLYITEEGFTLKTDIPTMDRISGSFNIPITNKIKQGEFSGNLGSNTSLYDVFTLTVNKDVTAAGLTIATESYSVYDTTSMVLIEKIN
jgi:predicted transcriptional regulator